jgi:hypothetical protein
MNEGCSTSSSTGDDETKKETASAPSLLGLFDPPPLPSVSSPTSRLSPIEETKSLFDGSNKDMNMDTKVALRVDVNGRHDDDDTDPDASNGSLSHMMRLFAPPASNATAPDSSSVPANLLPSPPRPPLPRPQMMTDRLSTEPRSNRSSARIFSPPSPPDQNSESTPLLGPSGAAAYGAPTDWLHSPRSSFDSTSLVPSVLGERLSVSPPMTPIKRNRGVGSSTSATPTQHLQLPATNHVRVPSATLPAIFERLPQTDVPIDHLPLGGGGGGATGSDTDGSNHCSQERRSILATLTLWTRNTIESLKLPTTYVGSFMYLLYHVVFCLALGSAIMRPHSPTGTSILGLMTKTAALGTVAASPVYWFSLSNEVPALYPTAGEYWVPLIVCFAFWLVPVAAPQEGSLVPLTDCVLVPSLFSSPLRVQTCSWHRFLPIWL